MLLDPEGFAVIGASREPSKVGHVIFKSLLKSKNKVYPVNPKTSSILGKKCYRSITDLKGKVSHAVIAVPAKIVPLVMNDCGLAGIKVAIIISAGFSEAGNKELEERVVSIAKKYGVRILGPNVLGVIIPEEYNASFFEGIIKKGGVSFISQSGALGVAMLDLFTAHDWGLRSFVSVGNTSDLTITDVLKELINDKETKCVIMYVESLRKGRDFINLCKNSCKPIFVIKAGTSEAGRRASATHTGSIVGSDEVYEAALKQGGVVRVKTLKSLINTALVCESYGMIGDKGLIITNAGGPGILMTDALKSVPQLPSKLVKGVSKKLSGVAWSRNNPVDVIGDAQADRYAVVFNEVKKFDFYDYVVVLLTPQAMTEPLKTAREVVKFAKACKKPVFPCFLGGELIDEAIKYMKKNGLFVFSEIAELSDTINYL